MVYVLLSVVCSVTVSVILKLARRHHVDTRQIIVWNYPVTVLGSWAVLRPDFSDVVITEAPVGIYLSLAVLLPGIFVLLSASIRHTGIVRTEVAQRLSLFISLLAAFWLFREAPDTGKLIGVAVGFVGILCSIGWHRGSNQYGLNHRVWLYPLSVFFGYGLVDILLKIIAQHTGTPYTVSLFVIFCLAMLVAFGYLIVILQGKGRFSMHAVYWGLVLGAFNLGNFLFYMMAHRALPENPSTVFTGMNVGVIALGALVGLVFFQEKLSRINKIGVLLAVVSVFIIAYS
ncbi:EamA-like transporter family protein [Parapedobacter luteus]|uniref:EamA-like transporter family protein n=1 Tax=Parapedobacter luteus TaxID=623280 RepID=A0A1T5C5X9_9SPHI|nr:EamA family transporter [Parapedobacter luteus]SKB54753.1 EamA-like transporter family protein [Parapedobacter luteus]